MWRPRSRAALAVATGSDVDHGVWIKSPLPSHSSTCLPMPPICRQFVPLPAHLCRPPVPARLSQSRARLIRGLPHGMDMAREAANPWRIRPRRDCRKCIAIISPTANRSNPLDAAVSMRRSSTQIDTLGRSAGLQERYQVGQGPTDATDRQDAHPFDLAIADRIEQRRLSRPAIEPLPHAGGAVGVHPRDGASMLVGNCLETVALLLGSQGIVRT